MDTQLNKGNSNFNELPNKQTDIVEEKYSIPLNDNNIIQPIQIVHDEELLRLRNTCFFNSDNKLTGLNLMQNDIDNIDFLTKYEHIERLDLFYNNISDLSPLKSLKNLTHLDLRWNQIEDISIFKELPNLQDINLYGNSEIDINKCNFLHELESPFESLPSFPFMFWRPIG